MSTGIKLLDQNWINMQRWGSRINRPPIPDFLNRWLISDLYAMVVGRSACVGQIQDVEILNLVGPSYLSAILLPRSSGHGHGV
jgi:hypothetical protein